jgi:tetratricopeptide (TPR) repeat protein
MIARSGENREMAVDLARRALRAAADDPGVLGRAALVLGHFGEDIDAALALVDRALALNPSFAYGWYWSGWLRLFAGQADLAIHAFRDLDASQSTQSARPFGAALPAGYQVFAWRNEL